MVCIRELSAGGITQRTMTCIFGDTQPIRFVSSVCYDEPFDTVVSLVIHVTQASGNVTLDTVSKIGSTGVTFISR